MEPRLEIFPGKALTGMREDMSLSNDTTRSLWQRFRSFLVTISEKPPLNFYSVQRYPKDYFKDFDAARIFEKWAAVPADFLVEKADGLNNLIIPEGLYAVFIHRGAAVTARQTFEYIFSTWLPRSNYELDERPHFEQLDERYRNDDPDSEEEIWIPVRLKHGSSTST